MTTYLPQSAKGATASVGLVILCLFLIVPSPAAADASPGWRIHCIDCAPWAQYWKDASVTQDALGHPHFAYGGDHLYYTRWDGSRFHTELADGSGGVGSGASIALDGQGQPHIVYLDGARYSVKYARRVNGYWLADTLGGGRSQTAIALSADGIAHVVYDRYGPLRYVQIDGASRLEEDIARSSYYTRGFSIAVDPAGIPHVTLKGYDGQTWGILHQWRTTGWQIEPIVQGEDVGMVTSLMTDTAGGLHVAFEQAGDIRYAFKAGDSWHAETVAEHGKEPVLRLDADGRPHIAYQDDLAGKRVYAARDAAGGWSVRENPALPYYAIGISDSTHTPVVYDRRMLYLSVWNGSAWERWPVHEVGMAPAAPSLALDAANRPHIVTDGLWYTRWTGAGWEGRAIDTGINPSLALDAAGRPHVGYAVQWDWRVKYATLDATGWQIETVQEVTNARFAALALGHDGSLHLAYSYHDSSLYRIPMGPVYVRRTGALWELMYPEILDGYVRDLLLGADGRAHMVYETYASAYYRYQTATGWLSEELPGYCLAHPSLALDAEDQPHIAAAGWCDAKVRYMYKAAGEWFTEELNVKGYHPELALDRDGQPLIAYQDRDTNAQMVARRTVWGWQAEVVDAEGGGHSSLVFGSTGEPYLAYQDELNTDLRLATFHWLGEPHWIYLPMIGAQ